MTKPLVVDASLTFRLVVPGPQQAYLQTLVTQWLQDGYELRAPTLWAYEMTLALCELIHFGDLTSAEGERTLGLIQALDIQQAPPENELMRLTFDWTVRLNRGAAYGSFYLALAETLQCELWTADQRLHNAVNEPWVRLVGNQE